MPTFTDQETAQEHHTKSDTKIESDLESKCWQPVFLSRRVFALTTGATLILLGIVGYLHFQNAKHGAVVFVESGNSLSFNNFFQYQYLPTILIVLYGVWISIIDLDVKRLEPWYQLSSAGTRLAVSPLFCRYDTDFFATVILKSAQSRQWNVCMSSILLILVTMIVPAVQNSMFTFGIQSRSQTILVSEPAQLVDISTQESTMSTNFLSAAYSVAWLGQSIPAFTTPDYALAPFTHEKSPGNGLAGYITSDTTMYWSELECWQPASVVFNWTSLTASFGDGRGCNVTDILETSISYTLTYDADYEAYYFAADSTGFASPAVSLRDSCPQFPDLFLAIWRRQGEIPNFGPAGNATAMFCEPRYYMQAVEASVMSDNNSIISYKPISSTTRLTDTMFNAKYFEAILATGESPILGFDSNSSMLPVDIADASSVSQISRLKNASVSAPAYYSSSNMIGFLVGLSQVPISTYLEFENLQKAYERTYKVLFAMAMAHNFQATSSLSREATIVTREEAVGLVSAFAISTEALLLFVSILCIALLWRVPRRHLVLSRNPDSLAETMIVARSRTIQDAFRSCSTLTDDAIQSNLSNRRFELWKDDEGGQPLLVEKPKPPADQQFIHNHKTDGKPGYRSDHYKYKTGVRSDAFHESSRIESECDLKYPSELSWTGTGLVALGIGLSIAIFVVISILSQDDNGLPLPASNDLSIQLILSFCPTALATLLGAYMTLLCRVYSFMRPMEDLKMGGATAARTLLVTYTSLPPQILFLQAIRVRHYLLAALSIMSLLSNVLTVSTAGIFLQQGTRICSDAQAESLLEPYVVSFPNTDDVISSTTVDVIYPVVANASHLTSLPSWTTYEYGYLPVSIDTTTSNDISGTEIEFEAVGYGAELACVDLLAPNTNYASQLEFSEEGQTFRFITNYTTPDQEILRCISTHYNYLSGIDFGHIANQLNDSIAAFELSNVMGSFSFLTGYNPTNDSDQTAHVAAEQSFCQNLVVKGWVRGRLDNVWLRDRDTSNTTNIKRFTHNATIVGCTPRLRSQLSLLRATTAGAILFAHHLEPPSYDLGPAVNLSATFNATLTAMIDDYALPGWHNDTIARDWSNYLYKTIAGNQSLLDANVPVPSFEYASSIVSETYSRMFAVQLFLDRDSMKPINKTSLTGGSSNGVGLVADSFTPNAVSAKVYTPTTRVYLSKPMYIITQVILSLDLLVLIVLRLSLPKPFLPRMPFTIASQIAFFADSHITDDIVRAGGDLKALDKKGYRYGYGRFIGKDGMVHVGIERAPFVHKLDDNDKSEGEVRSRWWQIALYKMGRRRTPRSVRFEGRKFEPIPRYVRRGSDR